MTNEPAPATSTDALNTAEPELEALRRVAVMFAELGEALTATRDQTNPDVTGAVYDAITHTVVSRVPGAAAASMTLYRREKFTTVSATQSRAHRADALQYELGTGPCVDAILREALYHPQDLRHDRRWPQFGARAAAELGWSSMLSFRLNTELIGEDIAAGLNVYAEKPAAFDDTALHLGLLLATHSALAVAAQRNATQAEHLRRALDSNRDIGVAMGILMARYRLTRTEAFDLLRVASQHTNRKLADIAAELGDTGTLDVALPQTRHRGRT